MAAVRQSLQEGVLQDHAMRPGLPLALFKQTPVTVVIYTMTGFLFIPCGRSGTTPL